MNAVQRRIRRVTAERRDINRRRRIVRNLNRRRSNGGMGG